MKFIELFESWFPKEKAENNQENVIIEYCKVNDIDYSMLSEFDKNNILKSIGFIRVKVEVIYPLDYMLKKYLVQDVGWNVTQKNIYLRINSSGRAASIDRCKILEYLPDIFDGSNPLLKK